MKNNSLKKIKEYYHRFYPIIFTVLFLILSIILICRHEFWRDEVHAWNIANNSNSLPQLFHYMRQSEGHPYIWHIILYFISNFISDNIEIMKSIHLVISTASVFLILRFSPFNKPIKFLLIFSYFFFYEYSIISRNYSIGILLIIIFCILYKEKYKHILPISIVLLLMGSCNIYSFIISLILSFLIFFDLIKNRNKELKIINKVKLSFAIVIILLGFILFYLQIGSQVSDNALAETTLSKELFKNYFLNLKTLPNIIVNGFIPVPELKLNFWNSNLILNMLAEKIILKHITAITILTISIALLNNKLKLVFIIGLSSIISFILLFYYGSMRHWGHIFILFFICLWLSQNEKKNNDSGSRSLAKEKLINIFLIIILVLSLFGSSIAFYYDYKYPFSNGKNAAEYIKNNFNIEKIIIVGLPRAQTETIAGYLNKSFYYPQEERFAINIIWNINENNNVNSIFDNIENLKIANSDKQIILIKDNFSTLSSLFSDDLLFFNKYIIKNNFINSIVPDENYKIFLLNEDVNHKLVKRIISDDFILNWKNFTNFDNKILNDGVLIKPNNSDPYFESNFNIMEFAEENKLLIKVDIEVEENSELTIYYKRIKSDYNENDKDSKKLLKGLNTVVFEIKDYTSIENIRIDPVNSKINCVIKDIEFYKFSS